MLSERMKAGERMSAAHENIFLCMYRTLWGAWSGVMARQNFFEELVHQGRNANNEISIDWSDPAVLIPRFALSRSIGRRRQTHVDATRTGDTGGQTR